MQVDSFISLEQAAIRWEEACAHLSAATKLSYAGEVKRLKEHLAKSDVQSVADASEAHWHGYLAAIVGDRKKVDSRKSKPLKSSSALQAARITRAFFRFCWSNGWLSWVPGLGSYRCELSEPEPQLAVPPELLSLLLDSGSSDDEAASRSRCTIGLVFWGGLRLREVAALLRSDVAMSPDGTARLKPAWRAHEVVMPQSWRTHLTRYEALRKERFGRLSSNAALICGIRSRERISVSAAWRILQVWPGIGKSEDPVALGSRLIRASFQELATDGIDGYLNAVERQTASHRANFPMRAGEGPTGKQLTAEVLQRMAREPRRRREASGYSDERAAP